jgi:hypothetical protein
MFNFDIFFSLIFKYFKKYLGGRVAYLVHTLVICSKWQWFESRQGQKKNLFFLFLVDSRFLNQDLLWHLQVHTFSQSLASLIPQPLTKDWSPFQNNTIRAVFVVADLTLSMSKQYKCIKLVSNNKKVLSIDTKI